VMQLLKVGYTVTNGLRNLETKCRKMLGDKWFQCSNDDLRCNIDLIEQPV
jgi:hypothetical protein